MVTINLFPWRPRWRAYQKRRFKKTIGYAFLFSTLLSLILYGVLLHKEYQARLRLSAIKRELNRYAALQARIALQTKLAAPISLMRELLKEQETTKKFFENLGAAYQAEVCFTSLAYEQNKATFLGLVRSPSDLSQFFQEWQDANLFSEIQIEKLEQRQEATFNFRVQGFSHAG